MEFIVTADLHFAEHQIFTEVTRDGENIWVSIARDILNQIREYMEENSIKLIIHAGDLFESRNRIPVKLIASLQTDISNLPGKVFLLRGTPLHDGDGDNFNGRVFQHIPNIQIFNIPNLWYPAEDKKYAFYFLPYDTEDNIKTQVKEWRQSTGRQKLTRIIFGHMGLSGAMVSNGMEPPGGPSLSRRDLDFWDWGFFGHYHLHQQVWKNFYQVGSPYRIDFAERNDPKGFLHFKDGIVKFVKLDVPGMAQITIDGKTNLAKWELSSYCNDQVNAKECFVKVVVRGNDSFIKNFDQQGFKKKIPAALGVRFEIQRIEDEKEVREVRIRKEDSPEDMLDRYLDYMQEAKQMEGLNPKMVKRIGLQAMRGEE